jgi:hypothetical protein
MPELSKAFGYPQTLIKMPFNQMRANRAPAHTGSERGETGASEYGRETVGQNGV